MTTLVMLPGLLLDRRLFEAQIRELEGSCTIIVPELWRARGLDGMASLVLDQAPQRFALLGLSMGGYVAFEILRRAAGRVARLALLDTQAGADDAPARAARDERIARARAGHFAEVLEELHQSWVHESRCHDQDLGERLRAMAGTIGPEGFVAEMQAIMSRPDSRADLPRIACPTLVLCGREDGPTPLEAHLEMARQIPEARLVVLPRCGHLAPLEQPRAVTEQLKIWLAG